jgi:hypothetical protein
MEARRGEKLPVVYGRKREGMAIERAKATNKIHSVCFIMIMFIPLSLSWLHFYIYSSTRSM